MGNILSGLKLGFKSYYDAILFIKKHNMWYYFLFPVLLFLGIYYLGFVFQGLKSETIVNADDPIYVKSWYYFLRSFYALLAVVMFSFMRYILIIILSPVLSVVSERVERILTGNKYKFNLKQLIKDIKRTMNLAIRNIVWEMGIVYGFVIVCYVIAWVFSISDGIYFFVTGTFSMFVAFYYYGFGFIDYLNERQRLTISESVTFVQKNRWFAIALGSVFTLVFVYSNEYFNHIREDVASGWIFTLVIIASIILAMIPIVTMVAATLGVHELVDLRKNPYADKKAILENEEIKESAPVAEIETSSESKNLLDSDDIK
jgi:CysZ protein